MLKNIFLILIISLIFISCSKKEKVDQILDQENIEKQMVVAYREGVEALDLEDGLTAYKKFSEAELLYPQSSWAPQSSIMAAYSLYISSYYDDAIFQLERHLKNYPLDKNLDYVHYLIGICYFEQLSDEKKDLAPLKNTQKKLEYVINEYPNSDFAIDAKFKLGLTKNILAAKEMHIGRYYMKTEKWIGAINRFKVVINNYDDTVFVDEALHRLVEIYFKIGYEEEAKKIAYTLGYNYGSSEWYKNSYKLFNKTYKPIKIDKNNKETGKTHNFLLKKFKSIFE